MTKHEYNGWANFETWNAALWLSNDYCDAKHWNERAEDLAQTADGIDELTGKLADELETQFDDLAAELPVTGFFADVVNASLREVNWHEIARHMVEDRLEELTKIITPTPETDELKQEEAK